MNTKQQAITFILIEDNPGHAFLFKRFLKNERIQNDVLHFVDGMEALTYLLSTRRKDPSIVILDLNLPLLHGFELAKQLRKTLSEITLPIVILSTTIDDAEIHEVKKINCQGSLRKPLKKEDFYELIHLMQETHYFQKTEDDNLCLLKKN